MTKSGLADSISACETLLEKGSPVDALVELLCLEKEAASLDDSDVARADGRIARLITTAIRECGIDYGNTRDRLLGLIRSTESVRELDACLSALNRFEDYATLESCRNSTTNVTPESFFTGFSEHVGHYLCLAATGNANISLGQGSLANAKVEAALTVGAYLVINRDQSAVATPLYPATRRLNLAAPVWAAAYDAQTQRFIVTLKDEDRVLAINATTLKTENVLESPGAGLRGLTLHRRLRRGYFNAEFANLMFSFDLDSFEIRRKIEGFSVRPERIYLDPDTDTLVTGNLGSDLVFPNSATPHLPGRSPDAGENAPDGKSLTLVDAEKEVVLATLATGRRPTAVDISAHYIAAGNFYDNTVTIYRRDDPATPSIVGIDVIQDAPFQCELYDRHADATITISKTLRARVVEGIAILEKRGWILVSGFDACILTVVDIAENAVAHIIPVQNRPFDVVVDEEEKYAYVSCHVSNQISVIDLDQRREVYRLETGSLPMDLALHDGVLLSPDSGGLSIYHLEDFKTALQPA